MTAAPPVLATPPLDVAIVPTQGQPTSLAQRALLALQTAIRGQGDENAPVVEERAIYRPDSWLIQRCWENLADAGAADQALAVARLAAQRQPLALIYCMHRLARQVDRHLGLGERVVRELQAMQPQLFAPSVGPGAGQWGELLLYAGATAALLDERTLAFACLERIDQLAQPWDRMIIQPDQRAILAETLLRAGPHPLTIALLMNAPRRFGDAGAHLVAEVTARASERLRRSPGTRKAARLLDLGVQTLRNASLTSLHSRRLTATVFGQAGMVDEVLAQLTVIANIQEARREGGIGLRQGDPALLRQVKRPTANADVDFQVYTLREAIRAMSVRQVSREARVELANRLALLGNKSDGWTAAGAATTLVDLGAIKFAVDVVSKIPANDPTRAEGIISLVRALLGAGEPDLAIEQVQKGLEWAHSYPGRNPERALIWGLADVYLERRHSDQALALLDQWEQRANLMRRMRGVFGRKLDDDSLHNAGVRLRAMLQRERTLPADVQRQVQLLLTWAPRLLEGEALVNFLLDEMLKPLLGARRIRLALSLLPALQAALRSGSGEKHAMRVATVAKALAAEMTAEQLEVGDVATNGHRLLAIAQEDRAALGRFVEGIWQDDMQRGIWQTVHGIDGTLPLVLVLEGPGAVAEIANAAAQLGQQWE